MTYKEDAIVALYEADDTPLTSSELYERVPNGPADMSTVTKHLHDDGFADRKGEGKRGDPYRYELTGKGEAAAKDLVGDDPDGDTGLSALGFGDDKADDEATRDPHEKRIADVENRLSSVEDAIGDADRVVAFDDTVFVETVLMVASSSHGSASKRRHVLSTLLGVEDADDKGLITRALEQASKPTDDTAEDPSNDTADE